MIIIIFSFLLMFLGILHAWLWHRQSKRIAPLIDSDSGLAPSIEQKLSGYTFGTMLVDRYRDFIRHLTGNNNRMVIIRHGSIVLLMIAVSYYLNNAYIKTNFLLVAPVTVILTVYMLFVNGKKKTRIAFELGFSEALNIINSSISAGNSITQGLAQCGDKVDGLVGEELRQVSQRLDIGEDAQAVLMDSYQRLYFREYYFFIVAILLNMKGGGQVKEVMSRLGQMISNGRIMERKKYAKTSETRMTVKILMAIPVGIFFLLQKVSPENSDILLNDPTGQLVLYYVIASELLGFFIIWLMMNKI